MYSCGGTRKSLVQCLVWQLLSGFYLNYSSTTCSHWSATLRSLRYLYLSCGPMPRSSLTSELPCSFLDQFVFGKCPPSIWTMSLVCLQEASPDSGGSPSSRAFSGDRFSPSYWDQSCFHRVERHCIWPGSEEVSWGNIYWKLHIFNFI